MRKMAESEQKNKDNCTVTSKETMVKQDKRENTLMNGGKGSGDDADSLEELPFDIGEHYLVRRSDDSWRMYILIHTLRSCCFRFSIISYMTANS